MFVLPSPRQHNHLAPAATSTAVAQKVTIEPDGVDHLWVMQMTFASTIGTGAPVVAALALATRLRAWGSRAAFAVRVGAFVWFVTAITAYVYARRYREPAQDADSGDEA